jgi:predicted O-methyltransferase YrrM
MTYPDWFSHTAKPNFEKHLTLQGRQSRMECLQLGVYTGDASLWMLQNLGDIELTDVDTWQGSDEEAHESMDFEDVYNTYLYKTSDYENDGKCYHYRTTTMNFLLSELSEKEYARNKYDFIYIDADHTTVGVLLDAELSWPLLKSGGILAFDDYTWGSNLLPHHTPKPAIDMFVDRHKDELEILDINDQYWVKKK